MNEASLTGESVPARRQEGDRLLAGTLSVDGTFLLRVTASGEERTEARIARLLEAARRSRTRIERIADTAAAVFTPAAVAIAVVAGAAWARARGPAPGLMAGLSVLLIACPCALGLATPLAVWEAIGACARRGIVLRDSESLERLARVKRVFFDKTGTLTDGSLRVTRVLPIPPAAAVASSDASWTDEEILAAAAGLEALSDHPLARAIVAEAARRGIAPACVPRFRVHPGLGVEGDVVLSGGRPRAAVVGGAALLQRCAIPFTESARGAGSARVFLAAGGRAIAGLVFEETLRPSAVEAIGRLRALGVAVEILTGDAAAPAEALSRRLGVPVQAGLSPEAKLEAIRRAAQDGAVAMVGEGLNDAPALAGAAVSVAMGSAGGASREASDVLLLSDDLTRVPQLLLLARRTARTIRRSLFWAFAWNASLIPLAAAARLTPIAAAAAMVGSSLFVVTGSLAVGRAGRGVRAGERMAEAPRGGWAAGILEAGIR